MVAKTKKKASSPHSAFENTRKVLRKQKRQQKKIHRRDHYLKKKNIDLKEKYVPGKFVKRPADSPVPHIDVVKKKKQKLQPSVLDVIKKERQNEINEAEKLKSQMEEQRKKMFMEANDEEDKVIKKLEKQLGLNKTKNKNNYFAEDGLDYLLEICDKTTSEQIVAAEKHLADIEEESDFEEDLAVVTGKEVKKNKEGKDKIKNKKSKENLGDDIDDENMGENSEQEIDDDFDHDDDEDFDHDDDEDLDEMSSEDTEDNGQDSNEDSDSEDNGEDSDSEDNGEDSNEQSDSESNDEKVPNLKLNKKTENITIKKGKQTSEKRNSKKEKIISENDLCKVFSDDEISHLSEDEDLGDDECNDEVEEENKKNEEKPDVWEDIYGRKRDKEGNVIKEEKGVYIPPHLRNKDSTTSQEVIQLTRQIKSVLNKLSGSNLHWACSSLEAVYSRHSRHAVSHALCSQWVGSLLHGAVPPRTMAEHAAIVALLHANIATEIGAHFLEELTKKFDELMQKPQPMEDKTLDNLIASLSHLYCFKIFHASLLYDMLSRLLEDITEKNIECVLVALRCVGGVLRKDDPLALKSFIHDTQAKVAAITESAAHGSRVKFLLEVLMAIKNNNLAKIPNYDPTYVEQLRKSMKSIIHKGSYMTTLNIRLEDLLKADERGKWWIVGSAWEGARARREQPQAVTSAPPADAALLQLARTQRMNTDVRRSIFCVIMSAEDYMDAFEKLQHLGLRGQQEREIVHVLVACCLNEKSYNPYYAVLGQKLCDFDRKYQLSIQFCVWDKIKDLDSLSKQSMTNLAQFLVHVIMAKGLPLSVLKVIQFSDLNKSTVRFMRQVLLAIIMNADLEGSLEVFHRISKPPKLQMFRDSLKLFIQHFLIKNADKKTNVLSDDEMATLRERTLEVDKILAMYESKLRF